MLPSFGLWVVLNVFHFVTHCMSIGDFIHRRSRRWSEMLGRGEHVYDYALAGWTFARVACPVLLSSRNKGVEPCLVRNVMNVLREGFHSLV